MKTLVKILTLLMAFLGSALGENLGWGPVISSTRSDGESVSPLPVVNPDYRESPRLQAVETLPLRLDGLGDQRSFRNRIVSPENQAANIYVGLAVGGTDQLESKTAKWSNGYASWEECIADSKGGYQVVMDRFKTNNFEPSRMVTVILGYTYFNFEESPPGLYHTALLIYMTNVCRFDQLSLERITMPLTIDCQTVTEQVVIPVPGLAMMKVAVELDPARPEEIAVLEWAAPSGVTLMSNWPEKRDWTTATYLYIKRWMGTGQFKARVWLKTENGQEAVYTHFGEMISPPVLEMSRGGQFTVNAAHGSDVEVFASADLKVWTRVETLRNVQPVTSLSVPSSEETLIFRGVSY